MALMGSPEWMLAAIVGCVVVIAFQHQDRTENKLRLFAAGVLIAAGIACELLAAGDFPVQDTCALLEPGSGLWYLFLCWL
jgi:hypothetical protein